MRSLILISLIISTSLLALDKKLSDLTIESLDPMHQSESSTLISSKRSLDALMHEHVFNTDKSTLRETLDVVDSAHVVDRDGVLQKYTYTYDSNGKLTSTLLWAWFGTVWYNVDLDTYSYDSDGNMVTHLNEYQAGLGNWVNNVKYTYASDIQGNRISFLRENWSQNDSAWMAREQYQYIYSYDDNGNTTFYLREFWEDSAWLSEERITGIYDGTGNLISQIIEEWNNDAWVNVVQRVFSYDISNNRTSTLTQTWIDMDWYDFSQETFTYTDNGDLHLDVIQHWDWDASSWANYHQSTFSYDNNGNRISAFHETWNGSVRENYWQFAYTFAANGPMTSCLAARWNGSAWEPGNGFLNFMDQAGNAFDFAGSVINLFSTTITTDVADDKVLISQYGIAQNYPNPFNPTTTINYELPEQSSVRLMIYDVQGQEITTLESGARAAGKYSVQWNGIDQSGTPVSTGVYFCRLEAGSYSRSIKMLYLK